MSPNGEQSLSLALGGGLAAVLIVPLVIALVIYLVVVPLGLRGIFDALGAERSRAWIPFVNLATVYRLGGQSEFWVIPLVIPISSWLGAIMLFVASHRINRRFGRSGWYTVLAVVLWWGWTLALGLQRRIDRSGSAEPLVWSMQRPPQAPLSIPGGDDSSQPTGTGRAPGAEQAVPSRLEIPPMPGRPHVNAATSWGAAPPAPEPSPVVEEQREAPRLETIPPAPADLPLDTVIRPAGPAPEASAPPVLEPDDDATIIRPVRADATVIRGAHGDETVVSARRRPRWWVQTSMGARVELTGASAILGRRPAAHPLYPGAQLIAVTDDTLSVSATHAVLEYVGGEWHVTDLDSTNGVWVADPRTGEESELGPRNRARIIGEFMLGELGVKVVQNA